LASLAAEADAWLLPTALELRAALACCGAGTKDIHCGATVFLV